jgi:hypothetical protein
MRVTVFLSRLGACLIVGLALAACKAQPLQKPVRTSDIAEGPETIEAVRKQLAGTWSLVSLVVNTADGKSVNVDAVGTLSSDNFGNLEIEYRVTEAGLKSLASIGVTSPNPVISTRGKAELDPKQKAIRYASGNDINRAFDPKLAALRANPFALERTRYYDFRADGTLRLATRHDSGRDAAVSIWKKAA